MDAACKGLYHFFDYDSDTCPVPLGAELDAQLRKICDGCPVKESCLTDAIEQSDWQCFRAGMNPRQLRGLFLKLNVPSREEKGFFTILNQVR